MSGPRAQPVQQAPPLQKLRVRYAKRGRARFTSSRDFGRAFERALRRAAIPMAYSSGFSPHPRISYANAAPTGAASEAEYLEIGVAEICDPSQVALALNAALPPGLDVLDVVVAPSGSLADLLTASSWSMSVRGVDQQVTGAAVAAVLAAQAVVVQRLTKSGLRAFDVRPAIVSLSRIEPPDQKDAKDAGQHLLLVNRHQEPLVRPDDVLTAMTQLTPAFSPPEAPVLTRLNQGVLDLESGEIRDPFAYTDR